ncbi:hypothetical protein F4780DRAFT_741498 [Xylariomycetidae sp. FL0641]|nr:hypothetical protein F4780DRAFT_741498 [Xylariomycetidae sp. FL0641]
MVACLVAWLLGCLVAWLLTPSASEQACPFCPSVSLAAYVPVLRQLPCVPWLWKVSLRASKTWWSKQLDRTRADRDGGGGGGGARISRRGEDRSRAL